MNKEQAFPGSGCYGDASKRASLVLGARQCKSAWWVVYLKKNLLHSLCEASARNLKERKGWEGEARTWIVNERFGREEKSCIVRLGSTQLGRLWRQLVRTKLACTVRLTVPQWNYSETLAIPTEYNLLNSAVTGLQMKFRHLAHFMLKCWSMCIVPVK